MFPDSNQLHLEPLLPIIRTCPEFTEPGPDSTLDYRRKASKINHRGPGEIKTLQSCGSFSASFRGLAFATKRHRWNNDNCLEGRLNLRFVSLPATLTRVVRAPTIALTSFEVPHDRPGHLALPHC